MTAYTPKSVPNQRFSFAPGGVVYNFTLRYFRDLLYVSIRNAAGNVYVGSLRCADRQWLLPYRGPLYGDGNFRFEDDSGHYPDYRNFGTSCRLVYYTSEEIAEGGL